MSTSQVLVADGGFGTQITEYVGRKIDGDPLWSSRFNITNPEAVIKTHLDFLRNGANFISTNTYQATNDMLEEAVNLAKKARNLYMAENNKTAAPLIMASIAPFGAHLHDGSEYTGNYADKVSPQQIIDFQKPRIDACLRAGVDALAIETIPNQMEAEAIAKLLCCQYPSVKFWLSFQCKDSETLAHGEKFADVVQSVWRILGECKIRNNCLAIGLNCVHPTYVAPLFRALKGNKSNAEKTEIPLVVYPNSGEIYDITQGCWMGKEDCVPLANYVAEWVSLGARIIGGCCRVYAADIREIAETVSKINESGHKINGTN